MKALTYLPSLSLLALGAWFFHTKDWYRFTLYTLAGCIHFWINFSENKDV